MQLIKKDDICVSGDNYDRLSFDVLADTWSENGQIEVIAPETLNIWHLFSCSL